MRPLDIHAGRGMYSWAVRLSVAILACLCLQAGAADPQAWIRFRNIGVEDGLPENSPRILLQDRIGFLWIGTQNGLLRYDGTRYKIFKPDPDNKRHMRGRSVSALAEGLGERLWIGTEAGLEMLDRKTGKFTHYPIDSGRVEAFSNKPFGIVEDESGKVWVVTEGLNLERLDQETGKVVRFRHRASDPSSLDSDIVPSRHCIYKDPTGRIWVGTQKGVSLFDPATEGFRRIRTMKLPNGIGCVNFLQASRRFPGAFWAGTAGNGLFLIQPDAGEKPFLVWQFSIQDRNSFRAAANWVFGLLEDRAGNVWLATSDGLYRFDPASGVSRAVAQANVGANQENAFIGPFLEDLHGNIWFRTVSAKAVCRFSPASGALVVLDGSETDNTGFRVGNRIFDMLVDKGGALWIGTWVGGLNMMDPTQQRFPGLQGSAGGRPGLAADNVRSLCCDRENLWIGTSAGLDCQNLANGEIRHNVLAPPGNDASINAVRCLAADAAGKIWVGGSNGISVIAPGSKQMQRFVHREPVLPPSFFPRLDELLRGKARAAGILTVGDGANLAAPFSLTAPTAMLVVCTGEGATELVDRGWLEGAQGRVLWNMKPENTFPAGGDEQNRLSFAVVRLAAGNYTLRYRSNTAHSAFGWRRKLPDRPDLWGIQALTLTPAQEKVFSSLLSARNTNSLSHNYVRAILPDHQGNIWAGTLYGLNRLNPATGEVRRYYGENENPASLGDSNITCIYEDSAGSLWVGTNDGGLSRFRPETDDFERYLPKHCILSIQEDHSGHFWLGTYELGLCLLDRRTGATKYFSERDGLCSDLVTGNVPDREGFLWLGTSRGLSRFDPARQIFKNYSVVDGKTVNDTVQTMLQLPDGTICLGGKKGLNRFRPSELQDNPNPPAVALIGFRLFGEMVRPEPNGPLREDISIAEEIVLPWHQNNISFEFAALHFSAPEKNSYAYMLHGMDKAWIHCGAERTANYTNLDPGTYTFQVKAANCDGVWNEKGRSIRIVITPPFWRTIWAYLLYAALIVGGAWGVYHLRVWKLKENEWRLSNLVDLRTYQLSKANEKLQEANTELETYAGRLAKTNTELEKANQLKTDLLQMAAHDLKNPLTAIIGFTDLLKAKCGHDAKAKTGLDVIGDSADRMFHLITELLETAAIEDGRLVLKTETVDMAELAEASCQLVRPSAANKNQELTLEAEAACLVNGDEGILRQVMDNLIGNAVKYSPLGKNIWVSVRKRGGEAWLEVRDEGPGLTETDKKRVFGKFQKLSAQPTGNESSTGLGLSIAKGLVELHGGRLWAESEAGNGASFFIAIPLVPIRQEDA